MFEDDRLARVSFPTEAVRLVGRSRRFLTEAARTTDPADRFISAHLSALRTAALVFSLRSSPETRPRRPLSAWVLLDAVAPELRDWSRYFADSAPLRAAVDAGSPHVVSRRQADEQLRRAADFLAAVEETLGLRPMAQAG